MTPEQVQKLSDVELRIEVAELLRWRDVKEMLVVLNVYCLRGYTPDPTHMSFGRWAIELPNWPKDLNACSDMEKDLTDIEFCKYVQILCGHTKRGVRIEWTGPDAGRACRATARQRCDAFVMVKGNQDD